MFFFGFGRRSNRCSSCGRSGNRQRRDDNRPRHDDDRPRRNDDRPRRDDDDCGCR